MLPDRPPYQLRKIAQIAVIAAFFPLVSGPCMPKETRNAAAARPNAWIFNGWGCKPEYRKAERGLSPAQACAGDAGMEWLYSKIAASADERAAAAGNHSLIFSSCRGNARLALAAQLSMHFGSEICGAHPACDSQSVGRAFLAAYYGGVRNSGIYKCCALAGKTGRCATKERKSSPRDCLCVVYAKLPGGRPLFDSRLKEAKRNPNRYRRPGRN